MLLNSKKEEEGDKQFYKKSQSESTHFIKQQPNLEQATIDYEKDTKTLTVTIPVATKEKEAEKTIPVTIK